MAVIATVRGFDSYSVSNLKYYIDKAKQENQRVLPIMINSPGGSIYGLMEMVDLLNASGLVIKTVTTGIAMSAGSILFALGQERYMSQNSTIMIHDASHFAWGKTNDVQAVASHVQEIEARAYSILNLAAGKGDTFFQDLVKQNKGSDLYLNAEKALEYGLATQIKIPTTEELLSINNSLLSDESRFQIYMQLAESPFLNQNKSPENTNPEQPKKEGKMELAVLLTMLTSEQKEPVQKLIEENKNLSKSVSDFTSMMSSKDSEITSLKQKFEEVENTIDEDFLNKLMANHQLKREDKVKEASMLKTLSSIPEAKQAYKNKLLLLPQVVEGQIPNASHVPSASSSSDEATLEEVQKWCKDTGRELNLSSVSSIQNAFKAYHSSLNGGI